MSFAPSDVSGTSIPIKKPTLAGSVKAPPTYAPHDAFVNTALKTMRDAAAATPARTVGGSTPQTPPRSHKRTHPDPLSSPTLTFVPGPSNDGCTGRARVSATPEDIRRIKEDVALDDIQSKFPGSVFRSLMYPSGRALDHPYGPILLEYATAGCPADTGPYWSVDQLEAAIAYGAHPTACDPEAAAACRSETLQKVEEGFASIYLWDDLKTDLPPKLKISPIAAIPHKSRKFRMILDLSKGVRLLGVDMPSVNEATDKTVAPQESMAHLGTVLPRLIYAAATAPESKGPILFAKFDIKDGYWRMSVPPADEWSFAYVLPKLDPTEPTQIVVPSALQMGWSESPAFFCSATETARDVADERIAEPIGSVLPHELEDMTIDKAELARARALLPTITETDQETFAHLLEVYIDDFCGLCQSTDEQVLRHVSSSILHSIYEVFPPPQTTGQAAKDNPVSLKKMGEGDGVWATRKELLGWVFDGVRRCIELPAAKVTSLVTELKQVGRQRKVHRKDLEKLRGRLRHAAIGMPGGRGLVSPLDRALRDETLKWVPVRSNQELVDALRDFRAIIKLIGSKPTHVRQLVAEVPGYIGFCDASGKGAGGVWFSGSNTDLPPIVWRVPWPPDITRDIISSSNPSGSITNSDLEMAGMLLHYLVLECICDLRHVHVAAWCDNTPTVSWTNKLNSSKSRVSARLVRALAIRLQANEASPLIALSIAGTENTMADVSSRAFGVDSTGTLFEGDDDKFLLTFNSHFPLPQDASWRMFRLPPKLPMLVISELRSSQSRLGSWLRITKKGGAIGSIGESLPRTVAWTHTSGPKRKRSASDYFADSQNSSVPEDVARRNECELRPFKSRFVPSARPAKWTDCQIHSTAAKDDTFDRSSGR